MNLVSKLRWTLIAASLVSGSALAAVNCQLTPGNSVITDGQTLQLAAICDGELSDIDLLMSVDGNSYTSVLGTTLDLASYDATKNSISFTSPINSTALGTNSITFYVDGTPAPGVAGPVLSNTAKVVIKPASGSSIVSATGFASSTAPVDASCGSADGTTVATLPTNGALCATGSKPALVVSGPTSYSWSCLSLTGGAEANCYATRDISATNFTITATASAGGSIDPSGSVTVAGGATKAFTVTPNPGYSINSVSGCGGSLVGNTFTTAPVNSSGCTVSATFSVGAPTSYTISATAGTGGSINPSGSVTVAAGTTKAFTVTPNPGYSINSVSGCGGSLVGNTFTTAPVNSSGCTVSATFSQTTTTGDDPGSGLWVPSGTTNRVVADPGGPLEGPRIQSYVPGCLNGGTANFSSGGCAASSSYSGTLTGTSTPYTVAFGGTGVVGSGKQVVLRYNPVAGAGSSVKFLRLRGDDKGNVDVNMRVWLSTDPRATYDSVPANCKQTSDRNPTVITGPGYCPISTSNPVYYLGIAFDEAPTSSTSRFVVDESYSDLY